MGWRVLRIWEHGLAKRDEAKLVGRMVYSGAKSG
jgi:hypothetical protein